MWANALAIVGGLLLGGVVGYRLTFARHFRNARKPYEPIDPERAGLIRGDKNRPENEREQ